MARASGMVVNWNPGEIGLTLLVYKADTSYCRLKTGNEYHDAIHNQERHEEPSRPGAEQRGGRRGRSVPSFDVGPAKGVSRAMPATKLKIAALVVFLASFTVAETDVVGQSAPARQDPAQAKKDASAPLATHPRSCRRERTLDRSTRHELNHSPAKVNFVIELQKGSTLAAMDRLAKSATHDP